MLKIKSLEKSLTKTYQLVNQDNNIILIKEVKYYPLEKIVKINATNGLQDFELVYPYGKSKSFISGMFYQLLKNRGE